MKSVYYCGKSSREPMSMPRAIEKDDCFTCTAKRRHCDRQLHNCKTCADSSDLCRYPITLRWRRAQPAPRRKRQTLVKRSPYLSQNHRNNSAPQHIQQLLNMVSQTDIRLEPYTSDLSPCSLDEHSSSPTEDLSLWRQMIDMDGNLSVPTSFMLSGTETMLEHTQYSPDTVALPDVSDEIMSPGPSTNCIEEVSPVRLDHLELLPLSDPWTSHALSYQHMHLTRPGEISSLFDIYSSQLCKIPITHDFPANPFRCEQPPGHSSQQMHAIVAITLQYLSRSPNKTQNQLWLRHSAKRARDLAFMGMKHQLHAEFLDTVLILSTLEHMCRGAGPWQGLLIDVMTIIESVGGVAQMTCSPRRQAQLAMFVWWDITISLLCRKPGFLPQQYYDFVLGCDSAEWTFFDLTGIPKSLVLTLVELVQLTHAQTQILSMKWALFDDTRVRRIEESLSDPASHLLPELDIDNEMDDEELIHHKYDCTACVQAWKLAGLLYIERVFHARGQQIARSAKITSLARRTFDVTRSCRSTSVISKQLLFPIFLAGAEANDIYSRRFVESYCKHWQAKTRYQLFPDTLQLLNTIWRRRDGSNGDPNIWWGSVLAELDETTLYDGKVVPIHYLLG